ncbi:hypothetical protein DL96DRAFT_1809915 [Flagelloscypha sp. PMI_526]|nr:hypothetical protein DL96DRAFT_1809915 [Flagelloscypha sp. PMI_526]
MCSEVGLWIALFCSVGFALQSTLYALFICESSPYTVHQRMDPQSRQMCLKNLEPVALALLQGLSERTGLKFSLIAFGPIPEDGRSLGTRSYHFGRTQRSHLSVEQHDKNGWTNVLNFFLNFTRHCYTTEDMARMRLPSSGAVNASMHTGASFKLVEAAFQASEQVGSNVDDDEDNLEEQLASCQPFHTVEIDDDDNNEDGAGTNEQAKSKKSAGPKKAAAKCTKMSVTPVQSRSKAKRKAHASEDSGEDERLPTKRPHVDLDEIDSDNENPAPLLFPPRRTVPLPCCHSLVPSLKLTPEELSLIPFNLWPPRQSCNKILVAKYVAALQAHRMTAWRHRLQEDMALLAHIAMADVDWSHADTVEAVLTARSESGTATPVELAHPQAFVKEMQDLLGW